MATLMDTPPDTMVPPPSSKPPMKPPKGNGKTVEAKPEEDDDTVPKGDRTAKAERTPLQPESIREVKRAENQAIADWLEQIRGSTPIQVSIKRTKPSLFRGKKVDGFIETREDVISEEEIRDTYGGGQYQLRVKRRNDQGSWVFLTQTNIDIMGDPRIDNMPGGAEAGGGPSIASIQAEADGKTTQFALNMLERQMQQVRDEQRASGMDSKMIEQLMKPMEFQLKIMQDQLKAKDQQVTDIMNKPPDSFQQTMLAKFVDGDQARVTALRGQYESELRMLKESHLSDMKRLEDRQDRAITDLRRDYERQLDQQRTGFERELASVKALHQQMDVTAASSTAIIKSSLDRDLSRLEREIADLKTENKALRDKKDKSVMDMVKEVNEFKDVLGVSDEAAEKSTIERIVDTALQSEQLFGAVNKWIGPKPAAPAPPAAQQQQLQQQPPRFVRNKRTGQVGKWNPATQQYEEVQRRAPGAGGAASSLDDLQIPPEQLQMAIMVLERAYANKVPPKNFAATISTGLPPEIYQAIRDHGIDGFVNKVAKLGASSPLRRQDGINWLREVGKILIGDDSPTQEDADNDELGDDLNDAPDDETDLT